MNEANIKNSPITFSQLAHPGRRFQGQYIDGGIAIAIYILGLVLINTLGFESDAAKMGVLVLPIAYYLLSDALPAGQSVGKKMLRMAVVSKKTGEPLFNSTNDCEKHVWAVFRSNRYGIDIHRQAAKVR